MTYHRDEPFIHGSSNMVVVLSQILVGDERVSAYYSKMHSPVEVNYCATRQELLAIMKSAKDFRPHLYEHHF